MSHFIKKESIVIQALTLLKKPSIKTRKIFKRTGDTKRRYIKFAPNKLEILLSLYVKNNYPSREEMFALSEQFRESFSKIENWFKHKRRTEVKRGAMTFTKKKVFTKEEMQVLMQHFLQFKKPTLTKYREIAKELNCEVKHIKNWFSYKRKLLIKIKKGKFTGIASNYHIKSLKEKCQQIFPEEMCRFDENKLFAVKKEEIKVGNFVKEEERLLMPNVKVEPQKFDLISRCFNQSNADSTERFQTLYASMMRNNMNIQNNLMKANMLFRQVQTYKQMNLMMENEMVRRRMEMLKYNQMSFKNIKE